MQDGPADMNMSLGTKLYRRCRRWRSMYAEYKYYVPCTRQVVQLQAQATVHPPCHANKMPPENHHAVDWDTSSEAPSEASKLGSLVRGLDSGAGQGG